MIISVFEMILPLVAAFGLGIVAKKTSMIDTAGCNALKAVLSKIIITVVLFDAMLFADYEPSTALIAIFSLMAHIVLFLLGFATRKFLPSRKQYFPFAVSTWEGGTLGIPLCMMIFGKSGMAKMAILDIGCAIPIFTMIIPYLQSMEGGKPSGRQIVKNTFSTPTFDAVILGVILGISGFGKVLSNSSVFSVYRTLVSSITGSCTFLILFTVGFGFKLQSKMIKDVLITVFIRLGSFLLVFGSVYAILVLSMPLSREWLGVFIIGATMPTSFGLMAYGKFTDNEDYMAGVISLATIINLAACVLVKIFLI